MSSFNWRQPGAAIISALSLTGCFQPLYSEAAHPGVNDQMRAIVVAPIKDRIGHYLEDELVLDINGTGAKPEPRYLLAVTTTQGVQTPTVESQIGAADAATVTVTAQYKLTSDGGTKTVTSGAATTSAVYDRTIQRFGNLRAARDAEIRIAKALATEIELRIAAALAEK
jgi:LPS-assembly lipoprotein